ncbi:unnamed protein product [Phyllotreta striolata]|uniref:C2H2-type domain-containing protein n=1 Tax=Phyllotreta striolata TaxID=444603 RepID=A0A9N9T9C3_PHYSR|nr:unnamed protein product [Phyllotreta striolata]
MFSCEYCTISGNVSCYLDGSSELLVPGRVTASTVVPQGAVTELLDPESLVGQPDVQQISVKISPNGYIELEDRFASTWSPSTHWIRALRLSDDCHSYNVQLKLQTNSSQPPKLVLQAVKSIEIGQELQLWFSEDVLVMLQMVFLTPANIQGQKKYVCNRCSTMYESPNPLKLHITLGCGKLSISTLWQRLHGAVVNNFKNSTKEGFHFQICLDQNKQQNTAIDLTKNSENRLYRPYEKEPSAFKPFKKEETNITQNQNKNVMIPLPLNHSCVDHVSSPVCNDDAQIETLVSSLGRSRQGYICLYCGKCYSRKYGLKIHIRTHTGYKPLKCKFCNRPFGDPSNLNKHVRLHAEGNTPYRCDLCGKIMVRRRDLERHLKSRHMLETHPNMSLLINSPDDKKSTSDEESKSSTN